MFRDKKRWAKIIQDVKSRHVLIGKTKQKRESVWSSGGACWFLFYFFSDLSKLKWRSITLVGAWAGCVCSAIGPASAWPSMATRWCPETFSCFETTNRRKIKHKCARVVGLYYIFSPKRRKAKCQKVVSTQKKNRILWQLRRVFFGTPFPCTLRCIRPVGCASASLLMASRDNHNKDSIKLGSTAQIHIWQ